MFDIVKPVYITGPHERKRHATAFAAGPGGTAPAVHGGGGGGAVAGRPVFLIVDEHPVDVATTVERWVQGRWRRLRLFFLPGYSPELNPDELLNQDVEINAVGRKRPRHKAGLVSNVRRYLWSTQRWP